MSVARSIHGCLILDAEEKLVVSAGDSNGGSTGSVEILDLSTEHWSSSQLPLPTYSDFYRFVSYLGTHVAFCCVNYNTGEFGASTKVYSFDKMDMAWRLEDDVALVGGPTNAESHVALDVEDLKICHYQS